MNTINHPQFKNGMHNAKQGKANVQIAFTPCRGINPHQFHLLCNSKDTTHASYQ
jgi:hypothetical protein